MPGNNRKELLVFGGTNVICDREGQIVTKSTFVEYIHEMEDYFDELTWVVPKYRGPAFTSGKIDRDRIKIFLVEYKNVLWLLKIWCYVIFRSLSRPYVLMFHASYLLPVLPFIKVFSTRFVVYLGLDYKAAILQDVLAKIPGWRLVFRLGHELPMKWADAVITRGRHLRKVAQRFNKVVFETVPTGKMSVSEEGSFFCSPLNTCVRRVLYLGKVSYGKGVADLLHAFQLLCKNHSGSGIEWQLEIVGEGEDRNELEKVSQALGLDGVRFHGWMEMDQGVERLFACSHVLVCPSVYPEGVPRVIDEAIVRGVPVVATRVGGIPEEFQEDEVLLIEPGKPGEMADGIEALVLNPAIRSRYIERARKRALAWKAIGSAAKQHVRILLSNESLKQFETCQDKL